MHAAGLALVLLPLLVLAGGSPESAPGARFDPVVQQMHGFTVHVDPALLQGEHAEQGARALSMLANHLERIAILVEGKPLQELQKVGIWIEHQHAELATMQYHPSAGWLKKTRSCSGGGSEQSRR